MEGECCFGLSLLPQELETFPVTENTEFETVYKIYKRKYLKLSQRLVIEQDNSTLTK